MTTSKVPDQDLASTQLEPKTFLGKTREEHRAEIRKQAEGWKPNERQREAMRKAREAAKKP